MGVAKRTWWAGALVPFAVMLVALSLPAHGSGAATGAMGRARSTRHMRAKPPASVATAAYPRAGALLGRLQSSRLGLDVPVVEGTGAAVLRHGAGHVEGTAIPGQRGNVAIAGHRDHIFSALRRVRPGDTFRFAGTRGSATYVVTSTEIVRPEATRVLDDHGRSELTLLTCYPFDYVGAAPRRFVVHAAWRGGA